VSILAYAPARRSGALAPLARLIAALDVAACWLIVALLSAMVLVVTAQVSLRYGLNSSLGWADEVSRLTFVWTMFIAIPLGIKAGAHIGIELVTDRLPAAWRGLLQRLMALLAMAMLLLIARESVLLAIDQWDEMMSSLRFSSSWFVVPLVVCGVHGALHLLWIALVGAPARDDSLPQEPG
jgi:TRAP-type C4-dicarboxylate transport system permease small subunit